MRPRQQLGSFACTLCLLQAVACSNEERPRAEPSPAPVAPPSVAPAPEAPAAAPEAAADVEPSAAELPVSEDFEGEAEQQITAKNFRAELAKLEKEIPEDKSGAATLPAPVPAPAQPSVQKQK